LGALNSTGVSLPTSEVVKSKLVVSVRRSTRSEIR
jgi:hypothetical protein